jgi:rRNA maturation endonuclease Nob1
MGVRDVLPAIPDGGNASAAPETHVECRSCGSNLSAEVDECPDCGGEVAVYEL